MVRTLFPTFLPLFVAVDVVAVVLIYLGYQNFFARELEAQLPVRVDKVLLSEFAGVMRHRKRADHWRAAATSFRHLPYVERLLEGQ